MFSYNDFQSVYFVKWHISRNIFCDAGDGMLFVWCIHWSASSQSIYWDVDVYKVAPNASNRLIIYSMWFPSTDSLFCVLYTLFILYDKFVLWHLNFQHFTCSLFRRLTFTWVIDKYGVSQRTHSITAYFPYMLCAVYVYYLIFIHWPCLYNVRDN